MSPPIHTPQWAPPEAEEDQRRGRGRAGAGVREQVQVVLEERAPVFASALGDPIWMVPDAHGEREGGSLWTSC